MTNQTDEQMTMEQLNEEIDYLRKLCTTGSHSGWLLMQIEVLAREGLKLKEEIHLVKISATIVERERETLQADLIQCTKDNRALTAEIDSLRADGKRLDWVITRILSGGVQGLIDALGPHTIISRTAIDSARKDKV